MLNNYRKFGESIKKNFIMVTLCMVALTGITACGSSGGMVDLPKDFIKDFIAKNETMVDKSLVYYYVKPDQQEVAERIDVACRINKSKGTLESLQNATFDFSELELKLVDQKEEYIDDEPVIFVKVSVKGCYKINLPEATQKIEADDIIVLQMARNEWKVNNSNNPWS